MESPPNYRFDVYLSKHTDANGITDGWKASINKTDFVSVVNGTYTLDSDKYKSSFQSIADAFGHLPDIMFAYTVNLVGDNVEIVGLTETTVRVAIVDLVTKKHADASVKMVRPPLDFRVYLPTTSTAPATDPASAEPPEPAVNISSIFGTMDGDY